MFSIGTHPWLYSTSQTSYAVPECGRFGSTGIRSSTTPTALPTSSRYSFRPTNKFGCTGRHICAPTTCYNYYQPSRTLFRLLLLRTRRIRIRIWLKTNIWYNFGAALLPTLPATGSTLLGTILFHLVALRTCSLSTLASGSSCRTCLLSTLASESSCWTCPICVLASGSSDTNGVSTRLYRLGLAASPVRIKALIFLFLKRRDISFLRPRSRKV